MERLASVEYVALATDLYSGSGRLPYDVETYEEAGHSFMNEEGDPA